jgi:opacity protein-like surface antigen
MLLCTKMKKATLFLVAALLNCAVLSAQDGTGPRLGLKFAPNLGTFKPDTKGVDKGKNIVGYSFGFMLDVNIADNANYWFATGLFLNNSGGGVQTTSDLALNDTIDILSVTDVEYRLQYVEIPLTLKLKTNEIGYSTYYGQIGVGTGFNLAAKADSETVSSGTTITSEDDDVKDDVSVFRASLILGAGMEYNFSGNTTALVGFTYNGAFTNLYDGVKVNDLEPKVLQRYFEITLGVYF